VAKKKNKKDEVKVELPQRYKSETFEEPTETETPWDPLEADTDDEEEDPTEEIPCEECLEENIKTSWAMDEESMKKQEETLMQELGVKQAEHAYEVAKDVKIINCLILIARRLGALEHIENRRLKIDEEYLEYVKAKAKAFKDPDNPYDASSLFNKFPAELRPQLIFDYDNEDEVRIRPRKYLGSDNWYKITKVVKSLGGDWVSKGKGDKNAYWSVPR